MHLAGTQFLLITETLVFLSVVFMHMAKRKSHTIYLYAIQSLLTASMLAYLLFDKISFILILVVILTIIVKVILAPMFFFRIIKKCNLVFSENNYLNFPITLLVIAIITIVAHSFIFKPFLLEIASSATISMLSLSIAAILISLFLIVNRRGALSQIVGVLSLENGIVAFSTITGLEQSPGIQIAIIFNILIWIIIATVFTSMLFKHFGSISIDKLNHLKE